MVNHPNLRRALKLHATENLSEGRLLHEFNGGARLFWDAKTQIVTAPMVRAYIPVRFQPMLGQKFATYRAAWDAMQWIFAGPAREREAVNESRLIAAGYPAGLHGSDRRLALKTLKWANHDDPTLRVKAQQTFALLAKG